MKARVTVNVFRNKTTGTYHQKGDVIELTDARFKEVSAKGLVEAVGRRKKTDDSDSTQDEDQDSAEEPEPDNMRPVHEYDGLAYIETPLKNKVHSQAKEHHERQQA